MNDLEPNPEARDVLRQSLRTQRAALTAPERLAAADAVGEVLAEIPEMLTAQYVAGYWAVGGELSLHRVASAVLRREQTWLLPVLDGKDGRSLRFAPWRTGAPVAPNRYGIPEPQCSAGQKVDAAELEVVLVPLLAFDRSGARLGSGAGYYDRTFAFLKEVPRRPAMPVMIGIGYAFQEVDAIEAAPWDVPLDFVATEHELIECRR